MSSQRSQSTTTTYTLSQTPRNPTTTQVLTIRQALEHATHSAAPLSFTFVSAVPLTTTLRSVAIRDHATTAPLGARRQTNHAFVHLQTTRHSSAHALDTRATVHAITTELDSENQLRTSSPHTNQRDTKALVRGDYAEHITTAPGYLLRNQPAGTSLLPRSRCPQLVVKTRRPPRILDTNRLRASRATTLQLDQNRLFSRTTNKAHLIRRQAPTPTLAQHANSVWATPDS